MSCRSTACSAALTSYARYSSGLSDPQVQSLFHELKRDGKKRQVPEPDLEGYLEMIESTATAVRHDPNLPEPARARLLSHLHAATQSAPVNGPTWYAASQIRAQADISRERLTALQRAASADLGMDEQTSAAWFERWRTSGPDAFEDYPAPEENFRYDRDPLVPHDQGTARALRKLGYEHYLAQPHPVFVYGTLRKGQGNHRLMDGAVQQLSTARLSGAAVYGAHRGFPYAKDTTTPGVSVVGDVVWLTADDRGAEARWALDGLEGFSSDYPSGSHYERVLREVHVDSGGRTVSVPAWTYLVRGQYAEQLLESDRIDDGDWVTARARYREQQRGGRVNLWDSEWVS
jgi:gamma-glutamylcyclotransferase (GGCT)/AIG2-like uncharacterized protein YtfP